MRRFHFSKKSRERLESCDPRLVRLFERVLDKGIIDVTILWGHRGKEMQNELYHSGLSKVKWPHSQHNQYPSRAVDAAPYVGGRISFDPRLCAMLAGIVLATAEEMNIRIRWGGNWDMDGTPILDQSFNDLLHYEVLD